jgi:hypothetical protein
LAGNLKNEGKYHNRYRPSRSAKKSNRMDFMEKQSDFHMPSLREQGNLGATDKN